jgi:hypothetical protein
LSDLRLNLDPASPGYGDLLVENGDLVIVDGKEAVLQHILQRLRTFLEEWFMDLTVGVPYLQEIFVKNPELSKIEALLINEILGTKGVSDLLEFSADPDTSNRQLVISFKAQTLEGIITYKGGV